jgi:hypothetical protein
MPPLIDGSSSDSETEIDEHQSTNNNKQDRGQSASGQSQDHPASTHAGERHQSDHSGRPQQAEGNRQDRGQSASGQSQDHLASTHAGERPQSDHGDRPQQEAGNGYERARQTPRMHHAPDTHTTQQSGDDDAAEDARMAARTAGAGSKDYTRGSNATQAPGGPQGHPQQTHAALHPANTSKQQQAQSASAHKPADGAQMKHKPSGDDGNKESTDSDTNEDNDMKAVARHRGLQEAGPETKAGALLREYHYKQKGAKAAGHQENTEQNGEHEHAHTNERLEERARRRRQRKLNEQQAKAERETAMGRHAADIQRNIAAAAARPVNQHESEERHDEQARMRRAVAKAKSLALDRTERTQVIRDHRDG